MHYGSGGKRGVHGGAYHQAMVRNRETMSQAMGRACNQKGQSVGKGGVTPRKNWVYNTDKGDAPKLLWG